MTPTQLRTFRTVAATLSFTRSAEILDYAQSSVSAQIRGLEDELGAPLFDRIGRRVALTEAGKRVLAYTDRAMALESEIRTALSEPTSYESVLRVGAPESMMTYRLPGWLARFRNDHPAVRLYYAPMVDMDLYRGVTEGRLDFAMLLQPPVRVDTLEVRKIRTEPIRVFAATHHRLAKKKKLTPEDLIGETVFLTESGCGYRHLFEQELAKAGNYTCVRLEFNSVEAIKRCVAAGLGVGFLPQVALQNLIDEDVLTVLSWEKTFSVDLQLVWHRQKWLSPVEAHFAEICAGANHAGTPLERADGQRRGR
jgi:DNA-binding transcriptional LysR family regulator